jgi:hypothetical protein
LDTKGKVFIFDNEKVPSYSIEKPRESLSNWNGILDTNNKNISKIGFTEGILWGLGKDGNLY